MNLRKHAVSRRLRNALKARGLKADAIEEVVSRALGTPGERKLRALPKEVRQKAVDILNAGGPGTNALISWCLTGKFRVYTMKGLKAVQESGRRVGLGMKGKKPSASPQPQG